VVRRQFGDVAHHASARVHRRVVFEVIEDDGTSCHYRQISEFGPLKLRQKFHLDRSGDGPLVNRVEEGQFTGGTVTFTVESRGDGRSVVEARLRAPLSPLLRITAPLLRAQIGRQLAAALLEDKADLESDNYGIG
jgi:hypothetical protein